MNKTAIVTGCAKGIGKEIALELARSGYNIVGTYNTSLKEIEKLKEKIEAIGVKFESYKIDFLNEKNLIDFTDDIKKRYPKIDVLVNNAALSLDNNFNSKTIEEFKSVLQVNLITPFILIQRLCDNMFGGVIINISSTDGINTYSTLNMDYSSSKAGLINLTKSLALELKNVKVYCICPNWVNTESIRQMNPDYLKEEMSRIGQKKLIEPKEVSNKLIDIIENDIPSGSIIVMEE